MSELEALQEELAELEGHIASWSGEPEEWSAEWMTRQSLLERQADLLHRMSLLEGAYDLEVFLEGDAVHDHSIDAGFVGEFLGRLQTALTAIVHETMGETGTRGSFSEAVVAASDLQLVATGPGSFMLALEGPRLPVQAELGQAEAPATPLDEAMDRLMAVVEAAETDVGADRLRIAISRLGGHRAVARAVELSKLLGQRDTAARFVRRQRFDRTPHETRFSVPTARRLGTVLEAVETRRETLTLQGVLSGVRWTAKTFELELDNAEGVIQGSVALALRQAVRDAFDRHVEATVVRTAVRSAVEDEESSSYSLVDLRPTGENNRFRLPGVDA